MPLAFAKLVHDGPNSRSPITGDDKENKTAEVSVDASSLDLADAQEERRFWFQRRTKYDPDSVATLV
jgi:hypothetical protein